MITRRFVFAVLVGAVLVGLASCSGGGSSSPGPVTLDLGPLVTVPVVPTDPTVPATTIAATTTTTTTELVTTTTVDPKAEVEAAYLAALEARKACAYDPVNCNYALIAVPGSPQDLFTRETMKGRIENDLRPVNGFGKAVTRVDDVILGGDVAFVTICGLDSIVLFDIVDPANPGDDIVFDDSTISQRVKWEMRRTNGVWLMFEGTELERSTGEDLCDF
jgi:hypothetical protein